MHNRVKMVREALELSQREFGTKLGVSRDVISNIEYGRVQMKDFFIKHMCDLYGLNEEWLRTGEGKMFHENAKSNRLAEEAIAIFRSLRPEFQDYALEQIRRLAELQNKLQNETE